MTKINNEYVDLTFTGGVTDTQVFKGQKIVGFYIPSGMVATSLTINTRTKTGTLVPVGNVTLTIDPANATYYEWGNVSSLESIQFVGGTVPDGKIITIAAIDIK